jgi:hypothetical protein
MAFLASCAGAQSPPAEPINSAQFSTRVSFGRDGYVARFPITNLSGKVVFEISCYSLDDERREEFAAQNGTDPVADLSCYLKDLSREHEYTMLGLEGESLQFTPAFFWFSDIGKCTSGSYRLQASVRLASFLFKFSNINLADKTASLDINVEPMPSATNDKLTEQSYQAGCA